MDLLKKQNKKHIMKLYEKIGDPLPKQTLNSPVFEYTKKTAAFLNSYYNIAL